MKITRRQLRRIIKEEKRLVRESIHSHLDGELTNLVFMVAQEVNEEYGEITVQDVVDEIKRMNMEGVINYDYDFAGPRHHDYFVSMAKEMTYEDVVDRMQELVKMGDLNDDLEDFYSMRKV